jgi:hypothetical protein
MYSYILLVVETIVRYRLHSALPCNPFARQIFAVIQCSLAFRSCYKHVDVKAKLEE